MGCLALAMAGAVDRDASDFAEACLARAFGLPTARLEGFPDPAYAYDAARNQYSSTLMLHDSVARKPPHALRLLVITERDIFIPMLSFVYGQAQVGGPVAIMSLARLRQEFYGLPPDRGLFLTRVGKEALHETGHTFGLTHCDEPSCAMRLSTSIELLDTKGGSFCPSCAILLNDTVTSAAASDDREHRSGRKS